MSSQPIWLCKLFQSLKLRVAQLYHELVWTSTNRIFNAVLNDTPVLSTFVSWNFDQSNHMHNQRQAEV